MNGGPLARSFEIAFGAGLLLTISLEIFFVARVTRRGMMTRKLLLLTVIGNLPFLAAFTALFLLARGEPARAGALGILCIGGVALIFLVLHLGLLLLATRKGRAWLGERGESAKS